MMRTRDKLNKLANQFYSAMGYVRPENFDFSEATHPQEKLCYGLAEIAYEFFNGDTPDYSDDEEENES